MDEFIAIINPPEAAILAIGSAKEMAVVENGQVKPGWRMKATISVDHRVSDRAKMQNPEFWKVRSCIQSGYLLSTIFISSSVNPYNA